jgi:hypothetical protein
MRVSEQATLDADGAAATLAAGPTCINVRSQTSGWPIETLGWKKR